jgi:hypothetical protein
VTDCRRRIEVEELEPRTLLSVLAGTLHGRFAPRHGPSGAGANVLRGSGTVAGLGRVVLTGSVTAGSLAAGTPAGRLTLANARGAVTLRLVEPTAGAAAQPDSFAFHILHKTGAFRRLTGEGTIELQLGASARFALALEPDSGASSPGQETPPPALASGVFGVVLEGPTQPVERPGVPDTRPVPGAVISVQPSGGGAEITRATADAMGMYQISLPPGAYRLVPLAPDPTAFYPRGIPQDVVIGPGQVLDVTLMMDTGIR